MGAALAQINLVEVILQDHFLGVFAFSDQRHHRFGKLPAQRALVAEQKIFHQLLRQRTAALLQAQMAQIDQHRAHDADGIDAHMAKKTLVFDGEN